MNAYDLLLALVDMAWAWLAGEENVICDTCNGAGGWNTCMSSPEWCKANPLPGRENIERGAIEWFTVERET